MLNERNLTIAEEVKSVADEIGASCSQVALRWLVDQPGVVAPIVGARKISQLEDNLGCLNIELSSEQRQRLQSATQPDPIYPNSFLSDGTLRMAIDGNMDIPGGYRDMY